MRRCVECGTSQCLACHAESHAFGRFRTHLFTVLAEGAAHETPAQPDKGDSTTPGASAASAAPGAATTAAVTSTGEATLPTRLHCLRCRSALAAGMCAAQGCDGVLLCVPCFGAWHREVEEHVRIYRGRQTLLKLQQQQEQLAAEDGNESDSATLLRDSPPAAGTQRNRLLDEESDAPDAEAVALARALRKAGVADAAAAGGARDERDSAMARSEDAASAAVAAAAAVAGAAVAQGVGARDGTRSVEAAGTFLAGRENPLVRHYFIGLAPTAAPCMDCAEQVAARRCDVCPPHLHTLCRACHVRAHSRPHRRGHDWDDVQPFPFRDAVDLAAGETYCSECSARRATRECDVCQVPFCRACYEQTHAAAAAQGWLGALARSVRNLKARLGPEAITGGGDSSSGGGGGGSGGAGDKEDGSTANGSRVLQRAPPRRAETHTWTPWPEVLQRKQWEGAFRGMFAAPRMSHLACCALRIECLLVCSQTSHPPVRPTVRACVRAQLCSTPPCKRAFTSTP